MDGATDYGDQGIFSNGSAGSGSAEPAPETPLAPYYGIEMLSKLGSPGDEMVTASSSQSLVKVHTVRRADGGLDVLIDNEDPGNSYTVGLSYNGFTPSGTPTVYTLANNASSITSAAGSASSVTAAPYSLTVVQIPGFGASVTITNQGTSPVGGWTLTWTWPSPGEAVQQGWNGTFSQAGQAVTATNASWNGTTGANGGTASIGFNGSDPGQDPVPAAFSLNGSGCSID